MKNRIKFLIYFFAFALLVQSFYPAYAIDTDMVEIIENAEEVQQKLNKNPLISNIQLQVFTTDFSSIETSSKFIVWNENDVNQHFREVIVPPPQA